MFQYFLTGLSIFLTILKHLTGSALLWGRDNAARASAEIVSNLSLPVGNFHVKPEAVKTSFLWVEWRKLCCWCQLVVLVLLHQVFLLTDIWVKTLTESNSHQWKPHKLILLLLSLTLCDFLFYILGILPILEKQSVSARVIIL